MVSLFQFIIFGVSDWQKISTEFILALHQKRMPQTINSTEAIVHKSNGFCVFHSFCGIHLAAKA